MDLHKLLAREVSNNREREAAIAFLRERYSCAIEGTSWEKFAKDLFAKAHEGINEKDRLKLYEVEGRPVGVVWPDEGMGSAWVWDGGEWRIALGLVNKSWLEGHPMSPVRFAREFPGADLLALEAIAIGFLKESQSNWAYLLTPSAGEIPDRDLIAAGYALTKLLMARQPGPFLNLAPKVIEGLNADLTDVLPLLAHWYDFARYELREPTGTDNPSRVSQSLPELAQTIADGLENDGDPVDHYLWTLRKAVTNFALEKSRTVARKVHYRLRQMPASGIFDRAQHRNVWDEYCLQVQHGPPELEWSWSATINPLIDYEVEQLQVEEQILLTLAERWESDDFSNELDDETVSPEGTRRLVLAALAELADEQPQVWVTG